MEDLNLFERAGYDKNEANRLVEFCDKNNIEYGIMLNTLRKLESKPTKEEAMSVMAKALSKYCENK